MTDKSPTQTALDRDTQIEELARENERMARALRRVENYLDSDAEFLAALPEHERQLQLSMLSMVRAALAGK
jgi:hypothetical protein